MVDLGLEKGIVYTACWAIIIINGDDDVDARTHSASGLDWSECWLSPLTKHCSKCKLSRTRLQNYMIGASILCILNRISPQSFNFNRSFLLTYVIRVAQKSAQFLYALTCCWTTMENHLDIDETVVLALWGLSLHEGLDERVGRLGVEGQGTGKGQEFRTAVEVATPESISTGVEELVDEVERSFEHRTLAGRHVHRHHLLRLTAQLLHIYTTTTLLSSGFVCNYRTGA